MAEGGKTTYVIGVQVDGTDAVDSATSSVDGLDGGLNALLSSADAATAGVDGTVDKLNDLAKGATGAGDAAKKSSLNYGELSREFGKMGGPIGKLGGSIFGLRDGFGKLSKNFGSVGVLAAGAAVGIGLVVAAAIAAAAAIGALVAKMVKFAISSSASAIEASNLREGLTGSAAAADALGDSIAHVASKSPQSVAEIGKLADGLWKAGKRGTELEQALLEASHEAAGLGKNPGPELLAKRMRDLSVIGVKFKDNVRDLFSGAKTKDATDKFLGSLSRMGDLFSKSTVEGRGLQKLFDTITAPLINGLTRLEPLAKAVFRGLLVGALDIAILAVRAGKALEKMVPEGLLEDTDMLALAFDIARYAMYAFVAIAVVVGVVIGVIVGVIALGIAILAAFMGTFLVVGAVVAAVAVAVVYGAYQMILAVVAFGKSGVTAAKDLISGLVGGIRSGVGAVVDAIKALAASAIGALKSALKISSPSKVFEDLAGFTVEGYVEGIEDGEVQVRSSIESLVTPPQIAEVGGGDSSTARSGGGVSIQGNTFVFNGVEGVDNAEQRFADLLTSFFEGDAIAAGAL